MNRFFLVNNTGIGWDNFKEKFKLGDYNRLRLKYKASPSKKVTVNIAVDFFSFHGIVNSPIGTYDAETATSPGSGSDDVTMNLDRAYVNLYFKKFDVTVGKQRVALGVSYLWAPLDLFNRVNTVIRSGDTGTSIYGLDLRGENFVGWWLEGGYFDSPTGNDTKLVLGFDYTFPLKNGLYWLNEFYYDASGEADGAN
ncbi:MAG: hypothetical protein GY940_35520 [bacterium]|nr:hypothetical protein [bacterium]